MTGGVVLGLELVASRGLTPFFGVSLNVWASILAVTLIALALGYKLGGMLCNRISARAMLGFYVASGALASAWMNLASLTYPPVLAGLSAWSFVAGSVAACLYILFVPLVILSALNPALVAILNAQPSEERDENDHGSGTVFFVSTVGSVLGVFVVAYALLPEFSNFEAYALLAGISAGLSLVLLIVIKGLSGRQRIAIAGGGAAMLLLAVATAFSGPPSGRDEVETADGMTWRVLARESSFYGNHAVVDVRYPSGVGWRGLLTVGLINNRVYSPGYHPDISFADMLELLALSGEAPPKTALVLGLGVGDLVERLSDRGIAVDAVELDAKVLKIAREHFGFDDTKARVFIEDARTFVRDCPKTYDVVAVDLFKGDGIPAHVVSRAFFADIAACLNDGGAVTMNAFFGTEDLATKKTLFRTIADVFGRIESFEETAAPGVEITQGYLLARTGPDDWGYSLDLRSMPDALATKARALIRGHLTYRPDDAFFAGVTPIRDERNDWPRIAAPVDTAYRHLLARSIPWQILLD